MRNLILLILLSINSSIIFSQNEEVFPLKNTYWAYSYNNPLGTPFRFNHFACGDTLVGDEFYRIIHNLQTEAAEGGIRVEGEQVYYHNFQEDGAEGLLFDFELEEGDTFDFVYPWWTETKTVTEVEFEIIEGVERKVITFNFGEEQWIRGIGSSVHNFRWMEDYNAWALLCCLKEGEFLYFNDFLNACTQLSTIYEDCSLTDTEEVFAEDALKIFPNPTEFKTRVDFSKNLNFEGIRLSILSSNLEELSQISINSSPIELDLSSYAVGLYFIRIEIEDRVLIKKLIKN